MRASRWWLERIPIPYQRKPMRTIFRVYHGPGTWLIHRTLSANWTNGVSTRVDLLAGGPPCQPFSRAGTSKIGNLG